jgi:uncharacterized protein
MGATDVTVPGTARAEHRIAALDVLRGVAILGTFATNAWTFALPGGAADLLLGPSPAPSAAETALLTLSNGKFLALLGLLFGVGIELQFRSALRRGARWPGRYPVRAAVLFAEGLLHYLLIFEYDVLMGYALASLLVARVVGRGDRVARRWIAVVGGTYAAALVALTALLLLAPDETTDPGGPRTSTPSTASWIEQVQTRIDHFLLFRVETVLVVPSSVVLFLVGSQLVRAGALADTPDGARRRRRLVLVGLGCGLPLNALTAWAGPDWVVIDRYLVPPLVAVGLLALVTSLVLTLRRGPVQRGLAAVGRTALSCYVGSNLLASVICYEWGLGLAARLDGARPLWVVGLWFLVSTVLVGCAVGWLRRFDRGPLELVAHRVHRAGSRGVATPPSTGGSPE